jgi:hypothetical protein
MIDGTQRVQWDNVHAIREAGRFLICRIGTRLIGVTVRWMLPGTTIERAGDWGRLVLPRQVPLDLGLI